MAWRAITVAEAEAKFAPDEMAALYAEKGFVAGQGTATSPLLGATVAVVREFVGAMRAANYPVNSDDTVPDQLRRSVLALAVVTFLRDFPKLGPVFMTDERKDAAKAAESIFEKICARTFGAIESPTGTDTSTGNWNSNPKVIGRMTPVPPPALQMQQAPTPLYANPNAPSDTVPSNSPGVPQVPINLVGVAGNALVTLEWDAVPSAVTYNVYKGMAAGQEVLFASATTTNWQDAAVVNDTPYYYRIASVNTVGTSGFSSEVVVTPKATGTP